MDLGRRRSTGGRGASVVAGSVWESRMKLDEVKGGFKVFNGAGDAEESVAGTRAKRVPSQIATGGKRKTWKPETLEGFERALKNGDDNGQLSVSGDGIATRSPVQARRVLRSETSKEIERSPTGIRRPKPKSDPPKPEIRSAKDEFEPEETGSGGDCKEFGVCEEVIVPTDDHGDHQEANNEEDVEIVDEEIEVGVEEKSVEIVDEEIEVGVEEKSVEIAEIEKPERVVAAINAEKVVVTTSEVKRVNFERKSEVRNAINSSIRVHHPKQFETGKVSSNVRKQSPLMKRSEARSAFEGSSTKLPTSGSNVHHGFPETHTRLQSFVDLIMWRDISRSCFIFGIGTFTILSSSYTKDLNISFISVLSYMGLVYLAAIFLFRSIVCRGVIDMDYTRYVVGEEEAIWLLKLVLPYLNEFLLKLKALFSGDPATTMKLAALLFVLARCGSSVTIWTMAKLSFFGVFTVPKVCSLYSMHITAYAKFWVRRFRDAWNSCSHKKGVTVAVFLLVWNLSSIVARIWAVFMLFVAFRYYQQNLGAGVWVEDGEEGEDTWHEPIGDQRENPGPTIVDYTKLKKRL